MSPEELRQQIAAMCAERADWPDEPGAWLEVADAVMALPAIRRALARDAAIEAVPEWSGTVCSACEIAHNEVLRRLRAVGGEQ